MGGCSTGRSTRKYGGADAASTLQGVTDSGATTTNNIAIGADVAGKALDIQDKTNKLVDLIRIRPASAVGTSDLSHAGIILSGTEDVSGAGMYGGFVNGFYKRTSGPDFSGSMIGLINNGVRSNVMSFTQSTDTNAQTCVIIEKDSQGRAANVAVEEGQTMTLGHYNKATGSFTQRVIINSSGYVGIGVDDPNAIFEVGGAFTAGTVNVSSINSSGSVSGTINAESITQGLLNCDRGGTNIGTYALGDILYCNSSNADSSLEKLGIGTEGQILEVFDVGSNQLRPTWRTFDFANSAHTGTLPVNHGGSGLASYTTGDLIYSSGSTTLAKLNIGSSGTFLKSTGSAPSWTTNGSTLTHLNMSTASHTGTLAVARGGTGIATYTAGDLIYSSGTTTLAKLAKGTDSQVLAMNSGATAPEWVTFNFADSAHAGVLPVDHGGIGAPSGGTLTAEDILVATGSTAFKRLVKGSNGEVLQMSSGVVGWGDINRGLNSYWDGNGITDDTDDAITRTTYGPWNGIEICLPKYYDTSGNYYTSGGGSNPGTLWDASNANDTDKRDVIISENAIVVRSQTHALATSDIRNVGINQTKPQYRLDVNGDINCSTFYRGNGSLLTNFNLTENAVTNINLDTSGLTGGKAIISDLEISKKNQTAGASGHGTLKANVIICSGWTTATGSDTPYKVGCPDGIYGRILGSNTIAASTITGTTTRGTDITALNGFHGPIVGSNAIAASTITSTSNIVVGWTSNLVGNVLSNTITATTGTFSNVVSIGRFGKTMTVTVASSKFVIDGVSQDELHLEKGQTYVFDQSDNSNANHIFKFAEAADAAGSTEYTTGVTLSGTPGSANAKTTIEVASNAPSRLYYYSYSGSAIEANYGGPAVVAPPSCLKTIGITMLSTAIGSSAGPILNLDRDQIDDGNGANGDYIGQIKFLGRSATGVQRNYAKITGKIGTATNGEEDGLVEIAAQNNGTMNPRARITGESLKLLNNTELEIQDYTDLEPPDETTGNSTAITGYGTYTASASSNDGDAWQGFKGGSNWRSDTGKYNTSDGAVTGQAASTTISGSATNGEWLQLELPYKVSLDSITIERTGTQANRGPGRFKLAGSNDGTTWTLVKDQSGSDITYTNDVCEISSITEGPYKYYRLVVTKLAGTGKTSVQIKYLKLYGKITTSSKGGNTTIGGSASIAGECSIGALGSIFRSVRAIQVDIGSNITSAEGDVTIPYGVTYPNVSKIIINATITSTATSTGPEDDVYACSIHSKTATNAKLRVQSLGGVTIDAGDALKAEIVIFELP